MCGAQIQPARIDAPEIPQHSFVEPPLEGNEAGVEAEHVARHQNHAVFVGNLKQTGSGRKVEGERLLDQCMHALF